MVPGPMTYRTPESRAVPVGDVLRALDEAQTLVLTTHINADGDGVGSQVALAAWLRSRGKTVSIINPTRYPASLEFLLSEKDEVLDCGSKKAEDVVKRADLAVILDTGEIPRIGLVWPLIQHLPTVVVDHHPEGPEPIPGVSLRDANACATGELVYDLLLGAPRPLPDGVAEGLYVALSFDTGSFRFSNTTSDTHRIVADLVEEGADPETLHRALHGNVPLKRLRLLAAALAHLEVDPAGHVAWMTVPGEPFKELGAGPDDIEGMVDFPRDLEGVEVALLFRETAKGATKVSLRSNGEVDVNRIARRFGGGGHVKASGALVDRPLAVVKEEMLAAVRREIHDTLGRSRGDAAE